MPKTGRTTAAANGKTAGLAARLGVRRDGFRVDVEFEVGTGEVVGLLGPNGAGKTTVLRALAGLVGLEEGWIELDGERLERRPVEKRPVGMVFQDYLLFPHLSVVENVAFGPRCGGTPAREARRAAAGWLERVGMHAYGRAKPRELSGGQAQRVALARALAVEPKLLLLDEPLAALDARTRLEIRSGLRRHLADFAGAALLVTHDPLDAMVLCDRLIVIEAGRIVQEGTPAEVARHPRTDYVARLVGLNLYRGTAHGHHITLPSPAPTPNPAPDRPTGTESDPHPSSPTGTGFELNVTKATHGEVFAAFPPTAVTLHRERPDDSSNDGPNDSPNDEPGRNLWHAVVEGVEQQGDRVRVQLDGPLHVMADVATADIAELTLEPGTEIWCSVEPSGIHTYPA